MVLTAMAAAIAATTPDTRTYILEKLQEHCAQALPCAASWLAHGGSPPRSAVISQSRCRGCPFVSSGAGSAPAHALRLRLRQAAWETLDDGQPLTLSHVRRRMKMGHRTLKRTLKPYPGLWISVKHEVLEVYRQQ